MVISDKFKHTNDGFKYFIGYQEDNIIRPLCIILPQLSGYIKCYENGGTICILWLKMIVLLVKYNETWKKENITV